MIQVIFRKSDPVVKSRFPKETKFTEVSDDCVTEVSRLGKSRIYIGSSLSRAYEAVVSDEYEYTYFSSIHILDKYRSDAMIEYKRILDTHLDIRFLDAPFLNTNLFAENSEELISLIRDPNTDKPDDLDQASRNIAYQAMRLYRNHLIEQMFDVAYDGLYDMAYITRAPWDDERKRARRELIALANSKDPSEGGPRFGRPKGSKSVSEDKLDWMEAILDWWPEKECKAEVVQDEHDISHATFYRILNDLKTEFEAEPEGDVEEFKARKRKEIEEARNKRSA